MKNPVCEELLVYQPTSTKDENLRLWFIGYIVFDAFLTITAIVFNSVTIQALRKTSSLPLPLKTLLVSLAVSDLLVGLLVQPFYIGLLIKWLQRDNSTDATCNTFFVIISFLSAVSFFGVVTLSGDRFLAVHLHLRYQELVTCKRVVVLVISIWVFTAFLSLIYLWVSTNIFFYLIFISGVIFLVCSGLLYYKIYVSVRRHRNQIQALQVQQEAQNDQITNTARLRKSAVGAFYVYLVFLLFYLPQFCAFVVVTISDLSTAAKLFFISSTTLLFLNSSLYPVIYCWKMRHIRRAVLDVLRNIFQNLRKASVLSSRETVVG